MLRRVTPQDIAARVVTPFDGVTLEQSRSVVESVRKRGEVAVREQAERFGELGPGDPLVAGRSEMEAARSALDRDTRGVLERAADRIRRFADAQRACLTDLSASVPGGRAGHTVSPVDVAGCYAPGGRYPLPSSVLMTAIPARAAGVGTVVVATPSRDPIMLAAAAIAGADLLLRVGGAHAVGALAFGVGVPACDVIVGPGNRWVTAAKHVVSAFCGIDMLAGPSELLVIVDGSADPATIAADLIAQAEHDTDALPCLVTTDPTLADRVDGELERQLVDLPTAGVARESITNNGWVCVVGTIDEAVQVSDRVAPEHLEILCKDAAEVATRIRHAGGVFIGERAAEVLGDYGAGPNHTLPTGRTARVRGGLCVFDFLRVRTWLEMTDASAIAADAEALGRIEGLEGHARSAARRAESMGA
jgi:phosphoribosyl-ATP pyrophosphohydrolase/phosphoribosyl-AMP cyclohydrolase/histidinol dehydrogenase